MNPFFIIFTALNIATAIINIISIKHIDKIEEYIEKKSHPTVVPVAEINEQFSEEDMKKIRELIKEAKNDVATLPKADERQCACDHLYDSGYVEQDPKHCCERVIFHCAHCNHEEIIPITRGLLTNTLIRRGF